MLSRLPTWDRVVVASVLCLAAAAAAVVPRLTGDYGATLKVVLLVVCGLQLGTAGPSALRQLGRPDGESGSWAGAAAALASVPLTVGLASADLAAALLAG